MKYNIFRWGIVSTLLIAILTGAIQFFFPVTQHGLYFIFTSFLITLVLLYVTFAKEAGNIEKYKWFLYGLKTRSLNHTFYNFPAWLMNVFQLILIYLFMIYFYATHVENHELFIRLVFACTTLALFVIRDGIAFHIIKYNQHVKNSGIKILAYFLSAYFFVPVLVLYLLSFMYFDPNDLYQARKNTFGFFYPTIKDNFRYGPFPPLVQILVFSLILYLNFKFLRKSKDH